jgi:HAD superfamily hydrolase (TIGR01509 family)
MILDRNVRIIMDKNIKWIFMDMGSTLIDETLCEEQRINETLKQDKSPDKILFINSMIKYAKSNKDAYKYSLLEYGLKKVYWNSDREELYPNVENVLKVLVKKYKLGIIANQNLGLIDRLKQFGILHYFDLIISSAEAGVSKPNFQIFQMALDKAKCLAGEAIMVGDRIDNDILPGQEIGMKTIWIKQGYGGMGNSEILDKKPDYIVSGLEEILEVL